MEHLNNDPEISNSKIVIFDSSLVEDTFTGGARIYDKMVIYRILEQSSVTYIPKLREVILARKNEEKRERIIERLLELRGEGFQIPEAILTFLKSPRQITIKNYLKIIRSVTTDEDILYDNNFFPELNETDIQNIVDSLFYRGEIIEANGKNRIVLIQALADRDVYKIFKNTIQLMFKFKYFDPRFLLSSCYRVIKNIKTRGLILNKIDRFILMNYGCSLNMHLPDNIKYSILDSYCFPESETEKELVSDGYIFFHARTNINKGILDLLSIMSEIVKVRPIRIYISGKFFDERIKKFFFERIKRLGLDDYIVFLGFLKRNELIERLKKASVFLYPSHSDTLSLSMLDAIILKVPVVCYNLKTLYSVYKDLKIVSFVEEFDYTAMAQKCIEIVGKGINYRRELADDPFLNEFIKNKISCSDCVKEILSNIPTK